MKSKKKCDKSEETPHSHAWLVGSEAKEYLKQVKYPRWKSGHALKVCPGCGDVKKLDNEATPKGGRRKK